MTTEKIASRVAKRVDGSVVSFSWQQTEPDHVRYFRILITSIWIVSLSIMPFIFYSEFTSGFTDGFSGGFPLFFKCALVASLVVSEIFTIAAVYFVNRKAIREEFTITSTTIKHNTGRESLLLFLRKNLASMPKNPFPKLKEYFSKPKLRSIPRPSFEGIFREEGILDPELAYYMDDQRITLGDYLEASDREALFLELSKCLDRS